MAGGTEWLAAGETRSGEPGAADDSMSFDRLGGVVGARGDESAGASKMR
jgi:hypothetical protein